MKKVRAEDAVGLTLCHDVTGIRKDFKGPVFKRGHIITKEDVGTLLDIGKKHVFIWEENAGEIHEDDAARELSEIAAADGAASFGPSEGKIVLKAQRPGMLRVNAPVLKRINSIGDITITTLPDHYPCAEGSAIASMRIVPLVTKKEQIDEARRISKEDEMPLLELVPYRHTKIGIIITGSEIYSGRTPDLFEPVIRKKVAAFPTEILGCDICDDDLGMLEDVIAKYMDMGADIIVMTGGMSVDPDDITPTAIRNSGARIVRHGAPSQPGNMLLVSYLNDTAIIGVPGAAARLPVTTFDVFLPQLMTGIKITTEDIVNLGDGGFCQSCGADNCHWPNCTFGRY